MLARDRGLSKRLQPPSGLSWAATTASTGRLVSTVGDHAAPAAPTIALTSRGRASRAIAWPRTQSSRRGQRTAASARRCTSRAVRGRRRPPRHCFPDGVGRPPGQEQSSCLGHARDRNARNAIARRGPAGRALSSSVRHRLGDRNGDQAQCRDDAVLAVDEQADRLPARSASVVSSAPGWCRPACRRRVSQRTATGGLARGVECRFGPSERRSAAGRGVSSRSGSSGWGPVVALSHRRTGRSSGSVAGVLAAVVFA